MFGAARALADSLVQVLLSLIVATMFWVNGDGLVLMLHDALLGGPVAEQALDVAAGAIRGVAYGVIGTAIQALLLAIGPSPGSQGPGRLAWSLCCSRSARSADCCSLDLGRSGLVAVYAEPADLGRYDRLGPVRRYG
jgi:hypothetical protein